MDCSDETVADEHGGVAVVVVDTGHAAMPFDADGNSIAPDVDDPATVDDDVGAVRGAGQRDPEVDGRRCCRPCLDGRAPADRTMGSVMVVVVDERVELDLQFGEVAGEALTAQPFLQGLLEPLDLAAGLGVVGPAGLCDDPDLSELLFEVDLEAAEASGDVQAVVAG